MKIEVNILDEHMNVKINYIIVILMTINYV